jgi:murein DD-endopeptidase MepM/ murein hydrolase activator NlpD
MAMVGLGTPTAAQEDLPAGPIYIVLAGDTLGDIASRFGVNLEALLRINNLTNPNLVAEGARLVIPGLTGIQGVLTTISVPYGENLHSLSRRYGISAADLARLNHLSSPAELYAGADLVIPQMDPNFVETGRALLAPDQSMLEMAVQLSVHTWDLLLENGLSSSAVAMPGVVLQFTGPAFAGPNALPHEISEVELLPLPLRQGRTALIKVKIRSGIELSGSLFDRPLSFFPNRDGEVVAIQGVHAMAEPGFYNLVLKSKFPNGTLFSYEQRVEVRTINYVFDQPLQVDPATIDPAITKPEDAQWLALMSTATPQMLWEGRFRLPSPLDEAYCLETGDCWTSRFGNRRSYNGSAYSYFHTGLDIAGGIGTEIFAPASGKVIFVGPLTVRGNATVIDHGWGVYSGYMHQSEIYVKPGDLVQAGQVIGLVGGTGRVEGPHLHWEMWANGVQVDPLEWLEREFP